MIPTAPTVSEKVQHRRHLRIVDGEATTGRSAVWPVVVLGAAVASGQVWGGLYKLSIWGPAAIAVAVVLVCVLVLHPARPSGPATAVLVALAGLAGLSAASMLWAESVPEASLQAHRWALYAGLFGVVALVVRDAGRRRGLIVGIGAAGAAILGGVAAILAFGDASSLFFVMRLTEPLGYVNGQAAALGFALWPALALAERARGAMLRGAGAATACLACGLLLLTQSRGALLAVACALCFLLAAIPGRVRRAWLCVFVGVAVAAAAGSLLGVYSSTPSALAQPADGVVHHAVRLLLVASLGCGLAWGFATSALGGDPGPSERLRRAGRWGLLAIAAAAVAAVIAVTGDPVSSARAQLREFTTLDTSSLSGSRLLAGGGGRYDYWRVAVDEFRAKPVLGVGAGNYSLDYFRLRRTAEDIRQPHSLELQALAELGLGGIALVLTLVAALLLSCVRAARGFGEAAPELGVVVASSGVIVSWVAQTSADWLHLVPSLTGVMICAAAVVQPPPRPGVVHGRKLLAPAAAIALTVLAAAGIGRLTLADRFRGEARAALATDPAAAIRLADRALRLQGDDLRTLYVKSAGFARRDDYANARATLLEAVRAEPHNFVPRVLLGDLATRRGDHAAAVARYRAAIELNPRDGLLRQAYEQARASAR